MKLLFIFLTVNWMCILPMLGWMLGAFLLGWLFRHLFGGNSKLNLLTEENNNLKLKHQSLLSDLNSRYASLETKHVDLQTNYSSAKADAVKLTGALKTIEELNLALTAANSKPPVEKIVEKRIEVPVDRIVEKTVEKKVEVPVEKIVEKIVEKKVEDTTRIDALMKDLAALRISLDAANSKPPVERIVEKRIEVPVDRIVEKIVEKKIEVPVEKIVEKIVEKKVEDTTKIDALTKDLAALRISLDAANSKPPVEKIVEKRIEVPVDRIVEKIVEKKIEVPVEKIVEVPAAKDYKAVSSFYGAKIVADDLKLVEGIGPKIEELFHAAGYKTWASVAKADPAKLKDILTAAGERFQMHNPGTWPKQCQMMVDDRWKELKEYQERLDAGVEVEGKQNVQPAAPKDYSADSIIYGKKIKADDLKLVEGIGPKIEELFHAAGYKTWASVAKADPAKLKSILTAAGERFQMHDPTTWPKQCQMMVENKWAELKEYQENLSGGKE